jgi:hypothetical protein
MAGSAHGRARSRTHKRSAHAGFGLFLAVLVVCLSASPVLAAVGASSADANDPSCPPGQKACLTSGEPPALGVYGFSSGGSGPTQSHAGRLTVVKAAAGYAFSDFRMWLGEKEGCSLGNRLATVEGANPLKKKGKTRSFGPGETETTYTWVLPHQNVKVKVGGQMYPGNLSASFLAAPPGSGILPGVEGHLTITPQGGAVCGGFFTGLHKGKP